MWSSRGGALKILFITVFQISHSKPSEVGYVTVTQYCTAVQMLVTQKCNLP